MTTPLPDERYPTLADLEDVAKGRIPHFAWEYLDSGTGRESIVRLNEAGFDNVRMIPRFMRGELKPEIETKLFGETYSAPFGIAPIGFTSLMWPGGEQILAKTASEFNIPYCLSTVAADSIENCGPVAGGNGWFQLYPPKDKNIREDLLNRAKSAGFKTLVITVDLPYPSMRERQRRAGLSMPQKITPSILLQILQRPKWAAATAARGKPEFANLTSYVKSDEIGDIYTFVGTQLIADIDWEYIKEVREIWDGPLVLKGTLSAHEAQETVKAGIDGVWVSNHGGRQFDPAPTSISVLPEIVEAVNGKAKILFDSGVRSGADVLRAQRLGADFVFLGRPFIHGIAALGDKGGKQVYEILFRDIVNNMQQLGVNSVKELMEIEIRLTPDGR